LEDTALCLADLFRVCQSSITFKKKEHWLVVTLKFRERNGVILDLELNGCPRPCYC